MRCSSPLPTGTFSRNLLPIISPWRLLYDSLASVLCRIRKLVDNAYNSDPRVARFKEADRAERAERKRARAEAGRARREEEERVVREAEERQRKVKI